MFNGRTALNLDAKGRLAIPSRHRERLSSQCDGRLVVTHHPYDNCLALYPEPQWQDVAREVASLSDADARVRYLKRRFLGQAVDIDMDSSGRCLIPGELRELVGLDKKVMLVGQNFRFEIWSEEAWNEQLRQFDDLDESAMPESVQELAF